MKNNLYTKFSDFLNESKIPKDNDLETLINLAKSYDDPYEFDNDLNRNKFGHNKQHSFLRERFTRLNRGTRLTDNDIITIYRAGDSPIVWGDYVYINKHDAISAYQSGQGKKVYQKQVNAQDVVETSIPGEYYYSPRNIAKFGEDLIELWYYANGKSLPEKENETDNLTKRISQYKSELKKMTGKYVDYHEFETDAYNLALKLNVSFEDYEEYFED